MRHPCRETEGGGERERESEREREREMMMMMMMMMREERGKDQFCTLSDETKGERESGYFGHAH